MPKASRETASEKVELEGYEGQFGHWEGGYSVGFENSDGHSETYETGDAYYAPPGHTPTLFAGSEIVEFHPTDALMQTMEVVTRNMEAAS